MKTAQQLILLLSLLIAWVIPASALTLTAPENRVWEIFTTGYDAPVAEAIIGYDSPVRLTSAYDNTSNHRAGNECRSALGTCTLFGPNAEFKAAEDVRALQLPATDSNLAGSSTLGYTTPNGSVYLQPGLSAEQQIDVLNHESVHAFFSVPDSAPFATFRQNLGQWGYDNSQLHRFSEEAIAETYSSGSLSQGLSQSQYIFDSQDSNFDTYAAKGFGGFVGGYVTPFAGPVIGGAVTGSFSNVAQQNWNNPGNFSGASLAFDTVTQAASGFIVDKGLQPLAANGLSSFLRQMGIEGPSSIGSVAKGAATNTLSGYWSNLSGSTVAKIGAYNLIYKPIDIGVDGATGAVKSTLFPPDQKQP